MGPPAGAEVTSHVVALTKSPLGLAVSLDSVVVPGSTQVWVRSCGSPSRGAVWYAFLVWVDMGILWYCASLRHFTGTRIPGVCGHGRPEVFKGQ